MVAWIGGKVGGSCRKNVSGSVRRLTTTFETLVINPLSLKPDTILMLSHFSALATFGWIADGPFLSETSR